MTQNQEPRIFICDIPAKEPSFEEITSYFKTFSKSIKEDEYMSLKNIFIWWMNFNGIKSTQT